MRELDIFEALPRLQSIGYQAMEICTRDGWLTAPDRFGDSDRDRLRELLQDLRFPPPPLMDGLSLGAEGDARKAMIERATATFEMAKDLNFGSGPAVVTTTEGESQLSWDEGRDKIRDSFVELADLAAIHNVVIAAEPHFGMVLDTPEKVVWLMDQTNHPNLKQLRYQPFRCSGLRPPTQCRIVCPACRTHPCEGRVRARRLDSLQRHG